MESNEFVSSLRPNKPTIYEVAKRYVACMYALSDILGIEPYTLLTKHREVISNVFQQASREGVRIAPRVEIPTLHRLYTTDSVKERIA